MNVYPRSEKLVTAVGAAGAAVTATLPAVPKGYHLISSIQIVLYNTAARTGGATPVTVDTTNLPGDPAFTFPSAGAVGDTNIQSLQFPNALRSLAVNTATTIDCPATTSVIWRVNMAYGEATE